MDKIFYYELNNNLVFLDFFIIFIFLIVVLNFVLKNKKIFNMLYFILILGFFGFLGYFFKLKYVMYVYDEYILKYWVIFIIIVFAPEIRLGLERIGNKSIDKNKKVLTQDTKIEICDAVFYLSSRKIGALITIENHTSLDQFADRAVDMDSTISKELLINIFTPLTPLHDGAVIIRNDKIRCAAAYFVLTENDNHDKTMGSRHRAGIGISEISDSLTIIVSEQTGTISVATEGVLMKVGTKEKLIEFMNICLEE